MHGPVTDRSSIGSKLKTNRPHRSPCINKTVCHSPGWSQASRGEEKLWWISARRQQRDDARRNVYRAARRRARIGLTQQLRGQRESPVPWLAVQVGERRGVFVGWEFSGNGRILAKTNGDAKSLDIRVGNEPDFKTDVGPHEVFWAPPAFAGCYPGDIDEGSYSLHRFILEKLRPRIPENYPDPTLAYNLYLDAGGNKATEADVLKSARTCHDLGFEEPSCPTPCGSRRRAIGGGDRRGFPAELERSNSTFI